MMNENLCACAHSTVRYNPIEYPDGRKSERWLCKDCGKEFKPCPVKDCDSWNGHGHGHGHDAKHDGKFPVRRSVTELTASELLELYDEARLGRNADSELRAEIERRMKPCAQQHYNYYQAQGLGQGSIVQALAQAHLGSGGNK